MRDLKCAPLRTILVEKPPKGDLIPGLLPEDGIAILTAAPKVGKTMLASQAALAVQEGRSFLGFPAGPKRKVLYCDGQSRSHELDRRFRLLAADAEDPFGLAYCQDKLQLANEGDINALIRCIKEGDYGFVIIDPLSDNIGGIDENDAGSMSRPLQGLQRLQNETGIAVLVVAHGSKSESHGRIAAKTRGSNAITAIGSTLMVLSSAGKKGKLAIEQRHAATSSIPLQRRSDGFWARDTKEVLFSEAA